MIKLKSLIKEDSVSSSYRQAMNALENTLHNFHDDDERMQVISDMNNSRHPLGKFWQASRRGEPNAPQYWPSAKKYLEKALVKKYKNMEKDKREDQKLLAMVDKFAGKMRV